MSVWAEPDVSKHVKDNTDYRLANLFEKLIIYSTTDEIGDYRYDVTGEEVTKIEVYDVSCTALMENFYEYRDQCTTSLMTTNDNYASSKIADSIYSNVTLGSLILLMNNKYSNGDFVLDYSNSYRVLPYEKVKSLLFGQDANASNVVREVTDASGYLESISKLSNTKDVYKPTVDQLISSKMKINRSNIEDTPEYRRLLAEYGEDDLNKIIMKLTTYNKIENDDAVA